jgi:hypothetical protein
MENRPWLEVTIPVARRNYTAEPSVMGLRQEGFYEGINLEQPSISQ